MRLPVLACVALASIGSAQNADLVIAGAVRDAVTGLPVPDVALTLSAAPGPVSYQSQGKTDSFGKFRFEKAPLGDYRLRLTKLGYVGSNFSENTTRRINAGAGIDSEDLRLTLTPTAAVRGQVLDALGRPVSDVRVYARGERGTFLANQEEDGGYLLENLPPGTYHLMVRPPYATRKATAARDAETGERQGYPNSQYYPGVEDPSLATNIALTGGERREGLEIRLRTTLLVELGGQIVDGVTREPLVGAEVELVATPAGRADETYSRRAVNGNDARFRFDLLTPGRYDLLIYRDTSKNTSPYVHTIDIGTGGMAESRFAVPPFGTVSGKLIVPDKAKKHGPFTIHLSSPHVLGLEAKVDAAGAFSFNAVPPGRWTVWALFKEFALDFPQLYIAAIRQNGRAGPLVIGEGASATVEIELSDQLGQLSGRVSDKDQRTVADAVVFINGEGRHRRVRATSDGGFSVKAPPGSYNIGAWEPGLELPKDLEAACVDRTTKQKVTIGESSFANLELCKP